MGKGREILTEIHRCFCKFLVPDVEEGHIFLIEARVT
jgi:hypothetical protein